MNKLSKSLDKLSKSVESLSKNADKRRLISAQVRMQGPDYGQQVADKAAKIKQAHAEPKEDLETKVRKRYKLEKDGQPGHRDLSGVHSGRIDVVLTHLLDEFHRRRNVEPSGDMMHKSDLPEDLHKDEKKKKWSPRYKILTAQDSNPKTAKGEDLPYISALLHLAPYTLAGCGNVCPAASDGCVSSCLNTAGRGGMIKKDTGTNTVQQARIRRTKEFYQQPDSFWKKLDYDIHTLKNHARFENRTPSVRLNGTSDISWEDFRPPELGGKTIFEAHPEVQFYDYTKRPDRMVKERPENYHLTFSRSEANHHMSNRLLKNGHNVTVVFGGKSLPEEWNGHKVISGDEHDFRFLDPKAEKGQPGYVVGLKAKGDAKGDKSGFVVWDHDAAEGAKPKGEAGSKLARIKAAQEKVEKSNVYPLEKKDDWEPDLSDVKFDQESRDIMKEVMKTPIKTKPSKPKPAPKPDFPNLHAEMKANAQRQRTQQKPGTLDYSKMEAPKERPMWQQKMDMQRETKRKEAIANAGGQKNMGPREVAEQALARRREENKPKKLELTRPEGVGPTNAEKNKKLGKSRLLEIMQKRSPYWMD